MQRQAHPSTYDRPIDADELQVPPEQQLQLGRGLRGIPPLDGPGDQPGELVVELIGECPGSGFDDTVQALLEAAV